MIDPMKPMVLPKTGAGTANPSPVLRASLNRGKIGATSKRLTTESPEDIAREEAKVEELNQHKKFRFTSQSKKE